MPVLSQIVGTLRLELTDASLREWDATVLASGEDGIVLDRSAFFPGGGGQPPDEGVLLWGGVQTRILGARKTADEVYLQPAELDPVPPPGTSVRVGDRVTFVPGHNDRGPTASTVRPV